MIEFDDPTDRHIVQLLLEGASNKAIARALGLPIGTVKRRLHRLYGGLGVTSRTQFALKVSASHQEQEAAANQSSEAARRGEPSRPESNPQR